MENFKNVKGLNIGNNAWIINFIPENLSSHHFQELQCGNSFGNIF